MTGTIAVDPATAISGTATAVAMIHSFGRTIPVIPPFLECHPGCPYGTVFGIVPTCAMHLTLAASVSPASASSFAPSSVVGTGVSILVGTAGIMPFAAGASVMVPRTVVRACFCLCCSCKQQQPTHYTHSTYLLKHLYSFVVFYQKYVYSAPLL